MEIDIEKVMTAFRNTKRKSKKVKKIDMEITNWESLSKGDVIKSIRKSGPYFVNVYGDKIYKGEYGYFVVDSLDYNGIHVYEYSPRGAILYHGGRRFIYMGETRKVDSMNRQPHKLIKVNK